MIRTLLRISVHKIIAFFGGHFALILVCALLCCCFAATSAISGGRQPDTVQVAIVDLCDGPMSRALCESISNTDGIRAKNVKTVSEGEDMILFDSAEVLLILDPAYDRKLVSDKAQSLVSIKTAPGSDSAQLIRETLAGLLIAQRSEQRVKDQLIADGYLSDSDALLKQYMQEAPTPHIYSVETYGAGKGSEKGISALLRTGYNGVCVLALLLILLTLTRRMSDAFADNVAERIETQMFGKTMAIASDFLSLFLVGVLIAAIAFLFSPHKSVPEALAWLCYSLCISGICLLVSRFNTTGRIDILAPFLAIVTSVVGGCFTDLSVLSEALRILARCVPQGQMLAAANGSLLFCPILLSEGVIAVIAAALLNRRSNRS